MTPPWMIEELEAERKRKEKEAERPQIQLPVPEKPAIPQEPSESPPVVVPSGPRSWGFEL